MVFREEYSGVYDALYQDKGYEKECDYIEALFKKYDYRPTTILDLGCGTGGHALILSKRGYKVSGVDRSASMLDIAKKKARDQRSEIEFIQGDITRISVNKKMMPSYPCLQSWAIRRPMPLLRRPAKSRRNVLSQEESSCSTAGTAMRSLQISLRRESRRPSLPAAKGSSDSHYLRSMK
jgi:SAM-dependent methyltransferase